MGLAWPAVLVALLTAWFTWLVSRQFFRKRQPNQFFWSLSLLFACLASVAYALCLLLMPAAWLFKVYYVLGAMWMPAIMGLGSLALVSGKWLVSWATAIVAVLGIAGTILLLASPVRAGALSALDGGAGTGILTVGWWLPFLIVLNSLGALLVIVVALISAWRIIKRQAPARFLVGNIWLAIGVLIISMAGTAARLGWPQLFWITMLVGWIVTFVGYWILSPKSAGR